MGEITERDADKLHVLPEGAAIGGFTVRRVLGRGGFGITYEGYNPVTEKGVAIKEFFPAGMAWRDGDSRLLYSKAAGETIEWALRKFQETTTQLCRLSHPNIVHVYDYLPANDTGYMIMEFLHGQTLQQWLKARDTPPSLDELRPCVEPVLDALVYVHGRGLIHRDIAPDNILITREARPVLIDFGSVSRDLGDARHQSVSSTVGLTKRHYTAPEQMRAKAKPTPQADIYSIGAVLYTALTGTEPADGLDRVFAEADPVQAVASRRLPGCPARAAEAIDKALALRPEARLLSMADLRTSLWPQPSETKPEARGDSPATDNPPSVEPARNEADLSAIAQAEDILAHRGASASERHRLRGALRRWGLGLAGGAAVVSIAAVGVIRWVPHKGGPVLDAAAIDRLGDTYSIGQGVAQDYVKARELYEKAAAGGNTAAMTSLGTLFYRGQGVAKDYVKAREWSEKAAAGGNTEAMADLGVLYFSGQGVAKNYAKAREWFEKAAANGNTEAMEALGLLYANGWGVAQDYAKAREWYEKAAAGGNTEAMSDLGDIYGSGQGVAQDYAKAREWYEKAVAGGNANAMTDLGILYLSGEGVARDYAKARELYEKAAAGGSTAGMYSLGLLYENGLGVAQDYTKASELYEKAAAGGLGEAMASLGNLYRNGQGVARDYAKARELYEKAAAGGNAAAMTNLGTLYYSAQGVAQNYAKAREWYEKAAAGGNAAAMYSLGVLYANGRGVTQDYAKAREWYEKAAAGGNAAAMNSLGYLFENGLGVAQDRGKARQWYEKAAAAGDADAKIALRRL